MPKNLRGKAAVVDVLTNERAELIALVMCINMSIYIRNTLKPNVPSEKLHISLLYLLKRFGKCKPWEEKRVQFILENQGESSISFCPVYLNSADLVLLHDTARL